MKGVVDRIEGEYVVVVLDEGQVINVKKQEFEDSVKEGDVVIKDIVWKVLIEETKSRKKEIEKYLDLFEE
ncbi:MAG: DUF3006 domain-containing protein [Clostridiales bacterium]|nr:DUF3006 domain-containing protein [Clostridiales bacterium]